MSAGALADQQNRIPEAERKAGFSHLGATFKSMEAGHKYDYSGTNDPIWAELKKDVDRANLALKQREEFLRTLKKSENFVDESSGEEVTVYPPVHTSTTTISCSIK